MLQKIITASAIITSVAAIGCAGGPQGHLKGVQNESADKLTVGKVQKDIKVGMSSADVIATLGSPNIVTTDEDRREQWVYDKISTQEVYSSSESGAGAGVGGGGIINGRIPVLSLIGFSGSKASGASSRTQKTLTIIIKFDNFAKVRDFAYHASTF